MRDQLRRLPKADADGDEARRHELTRSIVDPGETGANGSARVAILLAQHTRSEYLGLPGTTHTSLLVSQRYGEVVASIFAWLDHRPDMDPALSPDGIKQQTIE